MRTNLQSRGPSTFSLLLLTLTVLALGLAGKVAFATDGTQPVSTTADRIAIKGYDTVAYFTDGRPEKGSQEFELLWRDARWLFASAQHKELFARDPERYAPQFGGFCAGGVTRGKLLQADPEAWTIVDGKLYLNFDKAVRDRWRQNVAENIDKGNAGWTGQIGGP
jgi:hypothetical protein